MAYALLSRFFGNPVVKFIVSTLFYNKMFFLAPIAAVSVYALRNGYFGPAPTHAHFDDHKGTGLEDLSLWVIYGDPLSARRATVSAFLTAFLFDPRVALGFAHWCGDFDKLIFAENEVALKSPFSWWMLAFFPGV